MDKKTLSKYRGEVIDKFVNIESLINAIISQHYFKEVKGSFLLEVLYDEYFTFGLRRRILTKIIPDFDDKIIQDLNRLNTIRNYFVHCGPEFVRASQKVGRKRVVPDPRKRSLEPGIDFEKLYREFFAKWEGVQEYLLKVFVDLGGVPIDNGSLKVTFVGRRGRPQRSSDNN